ncbi:transcription elongation factor GreA [Candidatus Peregrinibacteria bacterium]|nr:transcription elongation factor GreA [Candidatus Peregrinibacteria bacterium]
MTDISSSDDKKKILITKEGLKKLQEELEHLKSASRRGVAERLKEAISYGDLSENAEYEDAKNEQAFIEGRIAELEEMIKYVKIIDSKHGATVQLGSMVCIKNLTNNTETEYTIVGSTEADPLSYRISNESPVGRAVLEKKVGDIVDVKAPGGIFKYEVVNLR